MGTIEIINVRNESAPENGVYIYIGRRKEGNILGNPYTHIKNGTLAQYVVADRDTAISKYESYFEYNYENDSDFRKKIDDIYDMYSQGKEIFLGCWCHPLPCHGDIIKNFIEMKYIKEKINKNNG